MGYICNCGGRVVQEFKEFESCEFGSSKLIPHSYYYWECMDCKTIYRHWESPFHMSDTGFPVMPLKQLNETNDQQTGHEPDVK